MLRTQKNKFEVEKEKAIVSSVLVSPAQWELSYFVKDNFWTRNFPTTASSAFLVNFFPGQDATVIKLLARKGYKLLGKTALDEFACGGTGLYATTGPLFNPVNSAHIVGGSSSGSAVVVAQKWVPFALGHDTGDSVRRPATYCGVVGFKPSYGLISRSGVIPMASSLDTVGILAQQVKVIKEVFSLLARSDPADLITNTIKPKFPHPPNRKKIAVIAGLETSLPTGLNQLYHHTQKKLKKLGYSITEIKIPLTIRENLPITYLILCSTELVSHLNSLQGITYGISENISITEKRSKNLGEIVKERLLIGTYFLAEKGLLAKAQKMRYLVQQWLKKIFQSHDFLLFPSTNNVAPPVKSFNSFFSGLLSSHWSDNLLLLANLVGLPSLSLPMGTFFGLPVSINLNSAYGQDKAVLKLATELEAELTAFN